MSDADQMRITEAKKVLSLNRLDISRIQVIGLARVLDCLLKERYIAVY
jgi:hypothetical protein